MRDCNSQLSPRADSSLIRANMSSQSASCVQVRKASRPSCSMMRSSSSRKPSSFKAMSSARREATSSTVTCSRLPASASFSTSFSTSLPASFSAIRSSLGASDDLALAEPADPHVAMDADIHQQTKTQHHRYHGGTAIGNQRQRHADHRNEPDHHRRIDKHVEKEIGRDAESQQPTELVAALERD